MAETNDLDKLPQEFPHIFPEVVFEIAPEVSYSDLVYLSQIVKTRQRTQLYGPLADSLRKIQWAKLAGMEATAIEKEMAEQVDHETLLSDPVGQVQHAKAIFEFVAHGKAALDSIAVFLNDYFNLGLSGGNRDFRKKDFCDRVSSLDVIGEHARHLKPWLIHFIDMRDEWIHRGSPGIALIWPPTEVGLLPIPKRVGSGLEGLLDTPLTRQYYWSTQEFVEFHFANLVSLFSTVLERCTQLEAANLSELPPRVSAKEKPLAAVPFYVTEDKTAKKIRLGQRTQMFLGGGSLKLE